MIHDILLLVVIIVIIISDLKLTTLPCNLLSLRFSQGSAGGGRRGVVLGDFGQTVYRKVLQRIR